MFTISAVHKQINTMGAPDIPAKIDLLSVPRSYRPDGSLMKLFRMNKDMNTYEEASNSTVTGKLHAISRLRLR
jgi:hypothetical protein